jgi:hypothetical protein
MRLSFTVLSVSLALLICNLILQLFQLSWWRFLGPMIGSYLQNAVQLVFYGSLLMFAAEVYGRIEGVPASSATVQPQAGATSPQTIVGIAVSVLLAIVFVIALAARGNDMGSAAIVWFAFVLVCGLVIDTPSGTPVRSVLAYSLWPAGTFLLASTSLLVLAWVLEQSFVVSGNGSIRSPQEVAKYGAIYAVLAMLAVPAIAAACIGRNKLLEGFVTLANVKPASLRRLKTNLNIALSIIGIVAAAILGARYTAN